MHSVKIVSYSHAPFLQNSAFDAILKNKMRSGSNCFNEICSFLCVLSVMMSVTAGCCDCCPSGCSKCASGCVCKGKTCDTSCCQWGVCSISSLLKLWSPLFATNHKFTRPRNDDEWFCTCLWVSEINMLTLWPVWCINSADVSASFHSGYALWYFV